MPVAETERELTFEVVFEPEEDGGYHVYAPALKGCHSYGATRAEAKRHIAEAIQLWLHSAHELGLPIPERETVEVTIP
ncbi:MAG: type II toxin-antitoxin system HicB family antitoxin [Chloroflexi bacterium]|nr:type II toxin-antitoxin system HicB family antitoxin [Chloroflexota bacterium]